MARDAKASARKARSSGAAGVYFTAAELSVRGYVALVTARNEKATDVVAVSGSTGKAANIQVKTNGLGTTDKFWLMGKNDQEPRPLNSAYAFVQLRKEARPEFFLVPANIVRENIVVQRAKTGSVWYFVNRDAIQAFKEQWETIAKTTA